MRGPEGRRCVNKKRRVWTKSLFKNQILLQDCESFLLGSSRRLRHGHNAAAGLPPSTSCQCRTIFVTFFRVPNFTVQKYPTISVLHPIFLAACSLKGGSCHLCLLNCCAAAARTPKRRSKFQHSFTFACRRYHRHSAQCLPSGVFESCVWCSRCLASL